MNRMRERLELNREELERLLERAKKAPLSEPDYQTLKAAVETLGYLTQLLEDRKTTIDRLRQILFGASTEKTRSVLKTDPTHKTEASGETDSFSAESDREKPENKKTKGHGRNGAQAYHGATKIEVKHNSLKAGDGCPQCEKGKVYNSTKPGLLVRLVGQAPLAATVYELEKLRCNLCGEVFTADAPQGVGPQKYDASSGSMIALLKYGSGLPFYRLEGLQESLGIPLPASTQWGIVKELAAMIAPAYKELIRQAAQGEVVHNDDTAMKVLALARERPEKVDGAQDFDASEARQRSGIFTSGIVSTCEGRKIALFFTGHKHAGENLAEVLKKRAKELGPPIQMCDALARNLPKELEVIVANCLAHARRKFIDQVQNFPEPCRYVLETLREVYQNDALAKENRMSPDERLAFHQAKSAPLMAEFEKWMNEQIAERKVEPNSGLGKAISYMTNHFHKLTLFLRVPGAPLDNNLCERALKKAILHRKNALFYKTENGAHVGDLFMSLIHTCQLAGVSPFDYLTELQIHAAELSRNPQQWMPWNYGDTLQRQNSAPLPG
jgi:transposase